MNSASSSLTDRNAAVLQAVVERYISTGEPVGSGSVASQLEERVSAATVRNVMAELERLGYLEQPHTSAGRQPTRDGYRCYVDRLLTTGVREAIDLESLRARLERAPAEVHELLHRTCQILAEMSELVGVVSAPPFADTVFQHVDFVALDGNRVLAIVVGRSGQVKNRTVVLSESMTQEQLDRAAAYLVRRFAGRSLGEVERRVRELLERASERLDGYERRAIALGVRSLTPDLDDPELMVEGAASLLSQPDFEARRDLQAVLEVIEERHALVRAMRPGVDAAAPRVMIGTSPLPARLEGCSLVAATYWADGHPLGSVAVLGPNRLQYGRAITLVESVAEVTSAMLTRFAF